MEEKHNDQTMAKKSALNKKLEAIEWGLFFIWTGIAFLAHLGWGVGLLGVGIIILGGQVARKFLALKRAGFWVVVGFLFIVGGGWELFHVQLKLVPILCIVAGAALLLSALLGRARWRCCHYDETRA
jgi:hypothetical protein